MQAILFLLFAVLLPAQDIWTANGGQDRTNAYAAESRLRANNLSRESFGKLFTRTVDGQIYAQPLIARGLEIEGAKRDVVFVATMHNSVYAFDARDPRANEPLWRVHLGRPLPVIFWPDYLDINPEVGILSTPLLDRANNTLFVVAFRLSEVGTFFELHALDIRSGAERAGSPVRIQGSVPSQLPDARDGWLEFDPFRQLQRPALTLVNGRLFLGFGSHGDQDPYHGWIFAYDAATLEKKAVFCTTPNGSRGGVWQAARGFAVNSDGSVFAAAANGSADHGNWGQAVLRLNEALEVVDHYRPENWDELNGNDLDVASGGIIALPDTDLLVAAGKSGVVALLQRNQLGGTKANDAGAVQTFQAHRYGMLALAYWPRNDGGILFTRGFAEPLRAWRFDGRQFTTTAIGQTRSQPLGNDGFALSNIESNDAVFWQTHAAENANPAPGVLRAFAANDLSRELWNSEMLPLRDRLGSFSKFSSPVIFDGRVYVATMSNALVVYGLLEDAKPGINTIVHGASGAYGPLAPGLLVAIKGFGVGPEQAEGGQVNDDSTGFTTQLAGTRVYIDGIAAPVLYTSRYQTNVVVPFGIRTEGNVEVVVERDGVKQEPFLMPTAACNPGLFTLDSSGSGNVLALTTEYEAVSRGRPIAPGQVVTFYATGLCGATPPQFEGQIKPLTPDPNQLPITLTVNGEVLEILYAGYAPGLVAGVYQINAQLAPDGQTSLASIVSLQSGNRTAQTNTYLPVQ